MGRTSRDGRHNTRGNTSLQAVVTATVSVRTSLEERDGTDKRARVVVVSGILEAYAAA